MIDPIETGEPEIERSPVRKNVLHMMSSQLITWVIATIAALIIPRFLGPETLGEFRLATSLWLIAATLTSLGTTQFLQLEIARHQREGLSFMGPVLVMRTLAFVASAAVVAAYVWVTADTARFVVIVVSIGVATLFGVWSEGFMAAFVGLERMSIIALAGAVGKLFYTVAVIVLLIAGADVYGIVAVTVLTAVGGMVYMIWHFRRVSTIRYVGWRSSAGRVLRTSSTFMAVAVALVCYQQIDLIVISWVAEKEDLGWYSAADTLFGSLLFPATVLLGVIFPMLGRLHESDPAGLRALISRTFSILAVIAVPVGLGTTLVARDFAPLLYGEAFRETGSVLAILGPVIMLTFGTILFGSVALATDRGRVWVLVMFGAALLTIPLDLVLVPWANGRFGNGAIGGALAYVVTEAVQFVIGVWLMAPFLLNRSTAWRTVRIVAAGGVMFAAGWPLRHLFLPVPVVVSTLVYALAVVAFQVLGEDERRMVGNVVARVGVRNPWAG